MKRVQIIKLGAGPMKEESSFRGMRDLQNIARSVIPKMIGDLDSEEEEEEMDLEESIPSSSTKEAPYITADLCNLEDKPRDLLLTCLENLRKKHKVEYKITQKNTFSSQEKTSSQKGSERLIG